LSVAVAPAVEAALERALAPRRADPATAGTISVSEVEGLVARYNLTSARELALLALPVAARLARPRISGYRVGVVGLDDGGDLVLGANLEFPGADLGSTVHAEGFASLRSRARGRTLAVLALTEARPCAHCRQTLAESIAADALELIDPLGHARRLHHVYPGRSPRQHSTSSAMTPVDRRGRAPSWRLMGRRQRSRPRCSRRLAARTLPTAAVRARSRCGSPTAASSPPDASRASRSTQRSPPRRQPSSSWRRWA
jgi:cytidine deaminase